MKKTLIFLKTHFINDFILNEFKKMEDCDDKNHKSILFIDNHTNFLKTKKRGIQKITFQKYPINCYILDEKNYAKTGLPYFSNNSYNKDFRDLMWYCCDYPIYIMRNAYPNYDYYWQIESDVFMNGENYKPFFERYEENDSDLIAGIFHVILDSDKDWSLPSDWAYKGKLKYLGIFPVIRLSNKAAKYLEKRRKKLAKIFDKIKDVKTNSWTYCEIFVPTELANNGYKCGILKENFVQIGKNFDFEHDICVDTPDNNLYHPVKIN